MDPSVLLATRREDVLRIARKWGVTDVRVFGSVARGEATQRSDIDLLVDLEPGRSLLDLVGFELDLQEALGVDIDAVTEPSLHRLIRDAVLAEAVPV
jgi:predicted nucleotidyltransferase